MATGDDRDMIERQIAVLPPWFGTDVEAPEDPAAGSSVLRLVLSMPARLASWLFDLVQYTKQQSRLRTMSGGWLDLAALDFFGLRIRRRPGQTDESFRQRILVELFRPRATRAAMASILRDLTGREPRIFEPGRPADVGGIGIPGGLAIGVSGAIGSINLPGEVFIDVFRSPDAGIPFAAGIGTGAGGIGVASRLVVANLDQIRGALTDRDIYDAIEATRPVGIVTWVRISTGGAPAAGAPIPTLPGGAPPPPVVLPPVVVPVPVPEEGGGGGGGGGTPVAVLDTFVLDTDVLG